MYDYKESINIVFLNLKKVSSYYKHSRAFQNYKQNNKYLKLFSPQSMQLIMHNIKTIEMLHVPGIQMVNSRTRKIF